MLNYLSWCVAISTRGEKQLEYIIDALPSLTDVPKF